MSLGKLIPQEMGEVELSGSHTAAKQFSKLTLLSVQALELPADTPESHLCFSVPGLPEASAPPALIGLGIK